MPKKQRKAKQVEETIQDLPIEIEALKKTETEGNQEMQNLGK